MENVKNLTLEERVKALEEQVKGIVINRKMDNVYELDINSLNSHGRLKGDEFLNYVKSLSEETTDKFGNVFVKLPTIYVSLKENKLSFSFTKLETSQYCIKPQLVSKYKNSLVNGQLRSIPNVAPNFNQFSFNKSSKFCKWVDGEQLNWGTVLYIQIMWSYAYGTKNTNKILPNEDRVWNTERDCGFADTGKGIGEFLGIEQLFTSGRNFVDFKDWNKIKELWNLYKSWNYNSSFDPAGKFGLWGDYDKDDDSKSVFFSCWYYWFDRAWCNDGYGVRLCNAPF